MALMISREMKVGSMKWTRKKEGIDKEEEESMMMMMVMVI